MAKRKKKEPASQLEPTAESTVSAASIGEPAPTVSIDAPPSKDVTHGDQAEQQGRASGAWREYVSEDEPDRRTSYPDPNVPFSIAHDTHAGVQLLKYERFKQVQLAFRSPVSGEIEGQLVAAGWKYRPDEKVYTKQYGEQGAGASMIEAKRLYDAIVEKRLDEKGISRSNAR